MGQKRTKGLHGKGRDLEQVDLNGATICQGRGGINGQGEGS